MIKYGFFDYKYNIEGFTSDLFSTTHIVFIVLAFLSIIAIGILCRKADHKKITYFLRGLAIFVTLLEASKIIWESYYDITTGRGFNAGGILPFYSCSLLIYCLWFGAWGKGKARDVALTWLATIGMCCGIIGTVYTNGLNWYPFWTFGSFYSLFFHDAMFITGVIMLATRYVELDKRDIIKAWVPILIISFIALPVNSEYGADYMQIYEGSGVPLMSNLAKVLAAHKLRWLFSLIMIASYLILSSFVVGVYYLSTHLTNKKMQKAIN